VSASKRAPSKPSLHLAVQYAADAPWLPARARLRRWVLAALERDAAITLRFVGSVEGRRLNRSYRGKDYATNVLTFVYEAAVRGAPLTGDIAICAPVIAREAAEQHKRLDAHCAHLVVHGMLHLQGYDHGRDAEARIMEARETQILARLRFADPYAL
jgi:probable rRNA maturation factor